MKGMVLSMIIGSKDFDKDKVLSLASDYEGLCGYVWTLVSDRYKHFDAIYHNTRYYINLEILKDNSIPLDKKMSISKLLTKNIRTVGYMGEYITCQDLEKRIDMNKVNKYYKGELNGKDC